MNVSVTKFGLKQKYQNQLMIAKGLVAELAPPHAQNAWGSRGVKGSSCEVNNIL